MKKILGIYKVGGGVLNSPENINRFIKNSVNMWPKSDPEDQVSRIFVISAFGHLTNLLQNIIDTFPDNNPAEAIKNLSMFIKEMGLSGFDIPLYFSTNEKKISFLQQGERISARKINILLSGEYGVRCFPLNAPDIIETDSENCFEVNFYPDLTQLQFNKKFNQIFSDGGQDHPKTIITEGFISWSSIGRSVPTLLGREGSDYSAAIFAHCAKNSGLFDDVHLTFIKSTPGVIRDWREGDDQQRIEDSITWSELVEMAEQGSKIFHPKVASLLSNGSIPAMVTDLDYFSDAKPVGRKTLIL